MSLIEILVGDARAMLRQMPSASVQTVVTSPPYFGLRDYGAEGQIGLEDSPGAFVAALVEVFREVRRVLRNDGTLWLNIGDSFAGSWGAQGKRVTPQQEGWRNSIENHPKMARTGSRARFGDAKPKDLLMIPAQVALALRADGWWLRKDIIWSKPNPMPESVEDRPTSAHEHVFLLAKSEAYFYDAQAIAEDLACPDAADGSRVFGGKRGQRNLGHGDRTEGRAYEALPAGGRNARDVWTIATQPCGDQMCQRCGRFYAGREVSALPKALPKARPPHRPDPVCRCGASDGWLAHYATMPRALAERCIRAGSSERGGCAECGAPWRRVVEKQRVNRSGSRMAGNLPSGEGHPSSQVREGNDVRMGPTVLTATTGWKPSCSCATALCPVPQRVLDPFGGAGTTALVARRLQRAVTLVELHPGYAALARARVEGDAPLLEAAE